MKIKWDVVTWYSRLLAAFVFILVFFAGFVYGITYERALMRPLWRELEQKRDIVNWLDRALLVRQAEISRLRGEIDLKFTK